MLGARAHVAWEAVVPPDEKKEGNGNVLGVGAKAQAHATDKAAVPQEEGGRR